MKVGETMRRRRVRGEKRGEKKETHFERGKNTEAFADEKGVGNATVLRSQLQS